MNKISKYFSLVMFSLLMLSSCSSVANSSSSSSSSSSSNSNSGFEIAFITDSSGNVNDGMSNELSWEGVENYAQLNGKSARYYRPEANNSVMQLEAIDLAIENGAKIIIANGVSFENSFYTAQNKYFSTKFVLIDGIPRNENNLAKINLNTVSISFLEQELGFLLGYSLVKENFTKFGFIGDSMDTYNIRYGVGFISGAYYAAKESNKNVYIPNETYYYKDNTELINVKAKEMYNSGVQVILATGETIYGATSAAIERSGAWVVGTDPAQNNISSRVITSSTKNIKNAVYSVIDSHYKGSWNGGDVEYFNASKNGIGLNADFSRFKVFHKEQYNNIKTKIANKTIIVPDNYESLENFLNSLGIDTKNSKIIPTLETINMLEPLAPLVKPTLSVMLSPSRDWLTLTRGANYLGPILKEEMGKMGYDLNVSVTLGPSYDSIAEALILNTADIGFISGSTYAKYSTGENMGVILSATRLGLNKDSDSARDWNDGLPTLGTSVQVPYYKGIVVAGTSSKGRELTAKVNSGQGITWQDLQTVRIGVQGPTSSSGRTYINLKFLELYNKSLSDLPSRNIIPLAGYGAAAAALASGQIDIALGYADFRRDYATQWTTDYGRTASIWAETDVVFVTPNIYTDAVAVSSNVLKDEKLKVALAQAIINISTDTKLLDKDPYYDQIFQIRKDIFYKIYGHEGYQIGVDSIYNNERLIQGIINNG
jgi:phosphonate transport system substrate-binding protein